VRDAILGHELVGLAIFFDVPGNRHVPFHSCALLRTRREAPWMGFHSLDGARHGGLNNPAHAEERAPAPGRHPGGDALFSSLQPSSG
jgi:hypothetical protein